MINCLNRLILDLSSILYFNSGKNAWGKISDNSVLLQPRFLNIDCSHVIIFIFFLTLDVCTARSHCIYTYSYVNSGNESC